ncbi:PAS domain-containing protein [Flavobacterium sp. SM15]|uniref:PAS domain-containing protein n=1 Tax=Flavobacterium sp. SM15 TaxID=2908005 RepID=UPI001EDA29CF|nr:PAS domain-containing protein [Flavobacterium sp. SM15]MCG2611988.1 PAS domain-containing protein [Flavobacterium sp. SM15]
MFLEINIEHSVLVPVLSEVIVSLLLVSGGYFLGKYRERRKEKGKNLDEYDFYPFEVDKNNFPQFNIKDFRLAVHYFLKNKDYTAARQLIFIGEQNNIRNQLESVELKQYEKLYHIYQGSKIENDNNEFLENYKRIVHLLGLTFKNMGIEILLHNLMNPSRSIMEIENGEVTGRKTGMGTTMLVLDLKKRKELKEDKLNYELNIGSRRFKCTTIPIYRNDYGLIGAICINIDINYISDEVLMVKEQLDEFFKNYCATEMTLDENILSKDEFEKAKNGKKHWKEH